MLQQLELFFYGFATGVGSAIFTTTAIVIALSKRADRLRKARHVKRQAQALDFWASYYKED